MRKAVAAVGIDGSRWECGSPLPDHPNTFIERIIRVGTYIEVFARRLDVPAMGSHFILHPPTISMVMSMVTKSDWEKAFADISLDDERFEEVLDIAGNKLVINKPFPGAEDTTIVAIVANGELVDLYILPHPGSDLDKTGMNMIFTLMPLSIQRTSTMSLSLQQWMQFANEAEEAAALEGDPDLDPDDEPEEDEPEDEEPQPVRTARAPAKPPAVPTPPGPMPGSAAIAAVVSGLTPAPSSTPNGSGTTEG